jgi:hypothetical protein
VSTSQIPIPMDRDQVVNTWFMEHRAKLIDIAAWLDRIDRATASSATPDFRDAAMRNAIAILSDGKPQRAKRILSLLSDHTTQLPQSAEGMKGASGAMPPSSQEDAS